MPWLELEEESLDKDSPDGVGKSDLTPYSHVDLVTANEIEAVVSTQFNTLFLPSRQFSLPSPLAWSYSENEERGLAGAFHLSLCQLENQSKEQPEQPPWCRLQDQQTSNNR